MSDHLQCHAEAFKCYAQEHLHSYAYSSTFLSNFGWNQIKFWNFFDNIWRLHVLGKERLRLWRSLLHSEAVRASERAYCSWKCLENKEPGLSWCEQRLKERLEQEKFHFDIRNVSQWWYWRPQRALPRNTGIPTPLRYWINVRYRCRLWYKWPLLLIGKWMVWTQSFLT